MAEDLSMSKTFIVGREDGHSAPLLTDPAGHGIDGPAFDVVIPSLPGYGFSSRPDVGAG
jgi:hypothetical protein